MDAASALERETHFGLRRFEVCDNVDLDTVLTEYESFYFVKFQKYPKLTKKLPEQGRGEYNNVHKALSVPQIKTKTNANLSVEMKSRITGKIVHKMSNTEQVIFIHQSVIYTLLMAVGKLKPIPAERAFRRELRKTLGSSPNTRQIQRQPAIYTFTPTQARKEHSSDVLLTVSLINIC